MIEEYDFSDLHNYPNVGLLKPTEDKIGKLRFGKNYKIRSHTQKLALTTEAKKVREYYLNDPTPEKMIEMYEKYGKIMQVGKGFKPFKFWEHQKEYIHYLFEHKEIIALMGRRLAKSTTYYLWALYMTQSTDDFNIGIGLNNDKLLKATSKSLKQIFEGLPPFLQHGVKQYAQGMIVFENDSSIELGIISGDLFRGQAKDAIELDEIDFSEAGEDVFDSIDAIVSESQSVKLCITSTPDGKKYMYKLWKASERGENDLFRIKYTWEARPDRDEEWAKNEIAKKGELAFARNHLVSFEGSSKTLVNQKTLNRIEEEDIRKPISKFTDVDFIDIFEEPIQRDGIFYFIGTDTSKATETSDEDSDAIAFHVIKFDLKTMRFEQVARMHSTSIHYTETSDYLFEIGNYYTDQHGDPALIIIENNSGDGQSIADNLANVLEYENVFYEQRRFDVWGFRTDRKSRDTILKNVKKLLEKAILTIHDEETLNQFTTFVDVKGKYQATSGRHDDLVMSLAIAFAWLLEHNNEFDITMNDLLIFHKNGDNELKSKILKQSEENDTNSLPTNSFHTKRYTHIPTQDDIDMINSF